jgi:pimeloyl-ACP methyl ester carboxylesterase
MGMLDVFRGHLPESEWYPAHEDGVSSRHVVLPSGERARVVEAGPVEGAPLVLIHGWGCSAYFFRKVIPSLAGAGCRVHAIDLRGHGASARPSGAGPYTGPAMRDFALAFLDALALERADVIAHSLGGGVALDVAAHAPSRVRSLTLLAPVGVAPMRVVAFARLITPPLAAPLVPYAIPRFSIPLVLRAVYGTAGRWASRDVDEYWAPTADPAFALALRELLHHYRFEPRRDDELRRVTARVLVLLGDRDVLVRSRATAVRAGSLPGWNCETFRGAGHVLAEEVPVWVTDQVLAHLSRDR